MATEIILLDYTSADMKNMTILALLFHLTIFSFAVGNLFRFQFGSIAVTPLDVLVFITVLFWSLLKVKGNRVSKTAFSFPAILFIFICILSLIINSIRFSFAEILVGSLYLIRWSMYFLIVFVLMDFQKETIVSIKKSLTIAAAFIIFSGYVQYFLYPNLRNLFYLGWDDHLYRLFSVFLDPNFTASILSLFLFALLPFVTSNKKLIIEKTVGVWVTFLIAFIALLLTNSRSGYIMFGVGSIILLTLLGKKKQIVFILLALFIGIMLLPKDLGSAGVELWRTASIFARIESAQQAWHIFRDNPLIGVGFNTYRYAQKDYGFTNQSHWELSHSGAGTDNSFLFVLATTGVIGICTYIFFWWRIISHYWYRYLETKKSDASLYSVVLASIVGLFVNAIFINSLFYTPILFWIWTLIGLAEHEYAKPENDSLSK